MGRPMLNPYQCKTDLRCLSAVYRLTCIPNGKSYVGSSTDVYTRVSLHFSRARGGKSPIAKDLKRYGSMSFRVEVLYISNDVSKLRKHESKFVKKFWPTGYNVMPDGQGTLATAPSHIRKRVGEAVRQNNYRIRDELSARAKAQHAAGKLGRQTWKTA